MKAAAAALLACSLLPAACSRAPEPPSPAQQPSLDAADARVTEAGAAAGWPPALAGRIAAIDADSPGELGVYLYRMADGATLAHDADRDWYLSSTVKVPVAIAVLQLVEEGALSLDEEIVLREADFVDGAGDLLWHDPGGRFSIATLLHKSIRNSDSTATDMLIRRIGADALNARIAEWVGDDAFGPITTILQVRYDAYGLLHPAVTGLSNMDLVRLKNAEAGAPRLQALAQRLDVDAAEFALPDIDSAFERYYASGTNSATLRGFGELLRRLAAGELLSPEHTALLLGHMQEITTGDDRIRAGLPRGLAFAQKTGTQLARACNVGIVAPQQPQSLVVAACVERFGDDLDAAERALRELGGLIGALVQQRPVATGTAPAGD